MRCSETALSRTTRAAGHGMMPPVMPRRRSWRRGMVRVGALAATVSSVRR